MTKFNTFNTEILPHIAGVGSSNFPAPSKQAQSTNSTHSTELPTFDEAKSNEMMQVNV